MVYVKSMDRFLWIIWITLISFSTCANADEYVSVNPNTRSQNHSPDEEIDPQIVTIYGVSSPNTKTYINERSIPTSSNRQRLQEQARRRYYSGVRIEGIPFRQTNVTNKYHSNRKVYPSVGSRTGQVPDKDGPFVPEIPEECKMTGICVDVPNYPQEYVDKLIEQLGPAVNKYTVEELEPDITSRLGPVESVIELCAFKHDLLIPSAAKDREEKWHFILNSKEKPLQGYRAEICLHRQKSCNSEYISIAYGYESICQQKYTQRIMTGIDEKGNMVDKAFQLPTCCNCVIKKN